MKQLNAQENEIIGIINDIKNQEINHFYYNFDEHYHYYTNLIHHLIDKETIYEINFQELFGALLRRTLTWHETRDFDYLVGLAENVVKLFMDQDVTPSNACRMKLLLANAHFSLERYDTAISLYNQLIDSNLVEINFDIDESSSCDLELQNVAVRERLKANTRFDRKEEVITDYNLLKQFNKFFYDDEDPTKQIAYNCALYSNYVVNFYLRDPKCAPDFEDDLKQCLSIWKADQLNDPVRHNSLKYTLFLVDNKSSTLKNTTANMLRETVEEGEVVDVPPIDTQFVQYISNHKTMEKRDFYGNKIIPVFIVSFPRSGTTLLESILVAHPNIDTLGEQWSAITQRRQFLENYFLNFDGGPSKEEIGNDILNAMEFRHELNISENNNDATITHLIDKNLINYLAIPLIYYLFGKDCVIINVVREPRDCLFGTYKLLHRGSLNGFLNEFRQVAPKNSKETLFAAYQHYRQSIDYFRANHIPITHIRYEDLVQNPTETTRYLFEDVLKIESRSSEVLELNKFNRSVSSFSRNQIGQGVSKGYVYSWKKYEEFLKSEWAEVWNSTFLEYDSIQ